MTCAACCGSRRTLELEGIQQSLRQSARSDYPVSASVCKKRRIDYCVARLRPLLRSRSPMSASDQASSQEIEFSGSSSALPADLVRALVWLRSHLPEPVRLDTLALIAGVRPRTLETHFRLFLGTTPLGWVRRARLARARQQLLNAGPRDTVTDIALASGFNQLSRFAGVYRKNFGEHPSTTIERTRKSSRHVDLGFDEAIRLTMEALPLAFAVAPAQCDEAIEKLDRPQELAPSYALPKAIA